MISIHTCKVSSQTSLPSGEIYKVIYYINYNYTEKELFFNTYLWLYKLWNAYIMWLLTVLFGKHWIVLLVLIFFFFFVCLFQDLIIYNSYNNLYKIILSWLLLSSSHLFTIVLFLFYSWFNWKRFLLQIHTFKQFYVIRRDKVCFYVLYWFDMVGDHQLGCLMEKTKLKKIRSAYKTD